MKARYVSLLLFLVPGVMLAALVAMLAVAAGAGALWIFVHGDDAWPESSRFALMSFAVASFVAAMATLLVASYRFGKKREASGGLQRTHVLAALGLTVAIPLLVVLHQWQVGNIGG